MGRSARTLENIGGGQFVLGKEHIGSDWDYPATAMRLGWSLTRVQRDKDGDVVVFARRPNLDNKNKKYCRHSSTDGTVDCRECKIKAQNFISAAGEYLHQRAG